MKQLRKLFRLIHKNLISANSYALKSGVKFGKNCKFLTNKFGSEPYLITIGDNFYSSSNVQFVTHDGSINVIRNKYPEYKQADIFKPITIGNNVFLGYGAIILPGTEIGDNVIIGAGSIVKGKVESDSIYAGMPAKFICSVDDYLNRNKDSFVYTKDLQKDAKKREILKGIEKNRES